jgi:hypothetical protein
MTLIALAVLTVGCGSDKKEAADSTTTTSDVESTTTAPGTTAPAKAAVPAACDLVTQAEAETLAGTPLDPPLAVKETCTYTGPVTGPTAQVEVFVGDGAKKFYDTDRDTLQHEFTPVPGVGDEAYVEENTIFLQKNGTWVSIRLVLLNDPAENKVPLETLAKTVADRI